MSNLAREPVTKTGLRVTLDPTEVCDWLRKNNGAYGRAAKHFGLPKDEVRRIWAENKSKPLSRVTRVTCEEPCRFRAGQGVGAGQH